MNILILGNGKGSWSMRGVQVGVALGARVRQRLGNPPIAADDLGWADVAVLVKRGAVGCAAQLHDAGVPILWDALDFWVQPADNALWETDALERLRRLRDEIRPTMSVGATLAMARALESIGESAIYIPHHSWAGLEPTPVRESVECVAYEGNPVYLGRWQAAIQRECKRRDWDFLINPPNLRVADIIVALRDGPWDGWMCREWKSGVKAVNAIAAGRPLITQMSAAVREIEPYGSVIESIDGLSVALDRWESLRARQDAASVSAVTAPCYRLDTVATLYRQGLARIAGERCAQ